MMMGWEEGLQLHVCTRETAFNPFRPNSDQHQISPCNIYAFSTPEVMRIKDMITQGSVQSRPCFYVIDVEYSILMQNEIIMESY